MKFLIQILFFCLLFLQKINAQTIFVRTENTKDSEYLSLINSLNGISFTKFFEQKYSIQVPRNMDGDGSMEDLQAEINYIENRPILKGEVEILIGLYRKISEIDKRKLPYAKIYSYFKSHKELQNYYQDFWLEIKTKTKSNLKHLSEDLVQDLKSLISANEKIFINGSLYSQNDNRKIIQISHQWLLISDKRYPVLHNGTIQGFIEKIKQQKYFSGFCFSEITPFPNMNEFKFQVLTTVSECRSLTQNSNLNLIKGEAPSFYKANKDWLIPAGVALGVLALTQLKDKKMTIKFPSFQF
mgnify:CR=1 FL=1